MTPPPTLPPATRPFYWSVRRELWEHPMLYWAPTAGAAVTLPGTLFAAIHLSPSVQTSLTGDAMFGIGGVVFLITVFVAAHYSLGALFGERRDRTILFWKSMPVSDLTTVLAKASIPLAVLPLIAFAVIIIAQLILLLLETAFAEHATTLWAPEQLLRIQIATLYSLIVSVLWYAPVYAWLLMVSAWAKRAPFVWAWLPPAALSIAELAALHTWTLGSLITHRLYVPIGEAFSGWATALYGTKTFFRIGVPRPDLLDLIDPIKFVSTPEVWIGLAVAALFIAAAIRLRRHREPI